MPHTVKVVCDLCNCEADIQADFEDSPESICDVLSWGHYTNKEGKHFYCCESCDEEILLKKEIYPHCAAEGKHDGMGIVCSQCNSFVCRAHYDFEADICKKCSSMTEEQKLEESIDDFIKGVEEERKKLAKTIEKIRKQKGGEEVLFCLANCRDEIDVEKILEYADDEDAQGTTFLEWLLKE